MNRLGNLLLAAATLIVLGAFVDRLVCSRRTVDTLAVVTTRPAPPPPPQQAHGMVLVPEGDVSVGTTEREKQRLSKQTGVHPSWFKDELPAGRMTLPVFWIDRLPVTNQQYLAFVQAANQPMPPYWGGCFPYAHAFHPVVGVSRDDAMAYCWWAGRRLPRAEEWERAARGDDGRIYPWGDEWDDEASAIWDDQRFYAGPATYQVGTRPGGASPFGILDMTGNVSQWTDTRVGGEEQPHFVLKGGSWLHSQRYNHRAAAASATHHSYRDVYTGFRCALDGDGRPALPKHEYKPPKYPVPVVNEPTVLPNPAPVNVEADETRIGIYTPGHGRILFIRVPSMFGVAATLTAPENLFAGDTALLSFNHPLDGRWFSGNEPVADADKLAYEAELKRLRFRARFDAGPDTVDFSYTVQNRSKRKIVLTLESCLKVISPMFQDIELVRTFMLVRGQDFVPLYQLEREAELPRWFSRIEKQDLGPEAMSSLLAVVSRDGEWVIGIGRGDAPGNSWVASNPSLGCYHADSRFLVGPRGRGQSHGRIYFIEGTLDDLRKRYQEDLFGMKR